MGTLFHAWPAKESGLNRNQDHDSASDPPHQSRAGQRSLGRHIAGVFMLDSNPFFRFIWRINALALFAACIIVSLLGLYALYEISRDYFRPRFNEAVAVAPAGNAATPVRATRLDLSSADILPGGQLALVSLHTEEDVDRGFSSGGKTLGATRNIIRLDLASGATSRLLADDKGIVLSTQRFPLSERDVVPSYAGMIAIVIDKDSNGDGRLKDDDAGSLIAWSATGTPVRIEEGIRRLHSSAQMPGRIRLLVETAKSLTRIDIDPARFEVLEKKTMDIAVAQKTGG
jgi:hypothetical protein